LSTYGTLKNVLKVIYAPHKAFNEITQNPKYIGPILIMVLFIAANTGFGCILASKSYYEETLPSGAAPQYDEWTENQSWWNSTAIISESNDSLSGGFYGNKSIEFDMTNGNQIWMRINFNQSIKCSGADGYKNISFRIKTIYPNATELSNAALYLFSTKVGNFSYNLSKQSLPSNNIVWNNFTIDLGNEWTENGNADWNNITSLMYDFTWSENANLTIRLDGLFFRGIFKSGIEAASSSSILLSYSLTALMQFVVIWVLLAGLMFIMSKGFKGKTLWKPMFIAVGFALITLFAQMMINVALSASLPNLYYPLEWRGGVAGEDQSILNKLVENTWLASQISSFVNIAIMVWTITLCAIATRLLDEFSWSKSFLMATVAYFVTIMAQSFLLGI